MISLILKGLRFFYKYKTFFLPLTIVSILVEALWSSVHDPKENTVTEQEMEKFHEVIFYLY